MRELLIYDRNAARVSTVVFRERPSARDFHVHDAEKIAVCSAAELHYLLASFGELIAFRHDAHRTLRNGKRQRFGQRHFYDAWYRAGTIHKLPIEDLGLFG